MNLLTIFRSKEKSTDVVKKFFFLSNVQVTWSTKEKAPYSNPDFPYFLIVSDMLTFYKIENVCFEISSENALSVYHSYIMRKDTLAKSKGACTL